MNFKWIKLTFFIIFLSIVAILLIVNPNALGKLIVQSKESLQELGLLGSFVFILLYALATVLMLPGSAFTLLAGALFGLFWGVIHALLGATLGAILAFLLGRYCVRSVVVDLFRDNKQFQKLESLTQVYGKCVVILTRLIPLFPFNMLNYGLALTKITLKTYVFWSFVAMIPGIVVYVVGGDAMMQFIKRGSIPWMTSLLGLWFVGLMIIVWQIKKKWNAKRF